MVIDEQTIAAAFARIGIDRQPVMVHSSLRALGVVSGAGHGWRLAAPGTAYRTATLAPGRGNTYAAPRSRIHAAANARAS